MLCELMNIIHYITISTSQCNIYLHAGVIVRQQSTTNNIDRYQDENIIAKTVIAFTHMDVHLNAS